MCVHCLHDRVTFGTRFDLVVRAREDKRVSLEYVRNTKYTPHSSIFNDMT